MKLKLVKELKKTPIKCERKVLTALFKMYPKPYTQDKMNLY